MTPSIVTLSSPSSNKSVITETIISSPRTLPPSNTSIVKSINNGNVRYLSANMAY